MTPTIQIGNLRLRLTKDQVSAIPRARLTGSIESADVRPADMPPAAVLIVRRLADPLPRKLLACAATGVNPTWERAVRATLSSCYRNASRPAKGPVPAGAEAVVFNDEAEMLACLLNDAACHEASTFWWWKRIRRPSNSWQPAALAAAQASWIPAAFTYLAARGQIARVLNAITPDESDGLLSAIAALYEIASIASIPRSIPTAAAHHTSSQFDSPPCLSSQVPPWVRDIFSATVAYCLGPRRERLLAMSLVLHHDRASISLPAVLRALAEGPANYLAAVASIEPRSTPSGAGPSPRIGSAAGSELPDLSALVQGSSLTAPEDHTSNSFNSEKSPIFNQSEESAQEVAPRDSPATSHAPVEKSSPTFPDEGHITELSGVLYLINVLRSLNLPECFASTWRLPEQINTWGLVDSIARGLLDNANDGMVGDPLWVALAGLAGRELHQALGASFTVADRYNLPRAWLSQWPAAMTDRYAHSAHAGRLYVWLQAGFVLARHDSLSSDETQARDILRNNFEDAENVSLVARPAVEIPLESMNGPLAANISAGLRDWLALTLPYIRRRLARSLGIEAEQVASELLRRRGRLYVTRTHVDVMLPMTIASIAIRRAGLDFDPGWVPELGRIVQFHYE